MIGAQYIAQIIFDYDLEAAAAQEPREEAELYHLEDDGRQQLRIGEYRRRAVARRTERHDGSEDRKAECPGDDHEELDTSRKPANRFFQWIHCRSTAGSMLDMGQ